MNILTSTFYELVKRKGPEKPFANKDILKYNTNYMVV